MKLFPRPSTAANQPDAVRKAAAHDVLDRLRRGEHIAPARVLWALRVTGDAE